MIYYLLATQYTRVKEYSRIINLHRTLPLVCPEFGIELPSIDQEPRLSPSYPWEFLRFVRLYHGEDFLVAMCNLESMELGQSRLVRWTTITSPLPGITNTTTAKVLSDNKTQASSDTAEPDSRKQAVLAQREVRADNKTSSPTEDHTEAVQEAGSEAESVLTAPALEPIKPPEALKPPTSTSSAAGQTTWQKLSSRS